MSFELTYTYVDGGIIAPQGFLAAGVSAGIKKSGKRDVCLLAAKESVPAAGVFTLSSMAAPPVVVSRAHLANGHARAVITNSGNANACTGEQGLADAVSMAAATADALGCSPDEVVVASTGVIGVRLPMEAVLGGISDVAAALDSKGGDNAAQAIMTTDTFPKQIAVQFECDGQTYRVGGMAKGSGMIMPNMATMLAYVTTDAPLDPNACDAALRSAVDVTFNRITVDSDTSTNDMCLLMASGAGGGMEIATSSPTYPQVAAAIHHVCSELARMVVRDGEGATKFIEVTVRGAETDAEARDAAMSIANSPLFKTAIFGGDANWGRVVMAVGKSSATVEQSKVDVTFAGITTCKDGTGFDFDEDAAAEALARDEIEVVVDLGLGEGACTVWTCDLSYEYVRINGDYRT
ncbi:MAG: bifunctional glutamate N-acetyltransferase/amino-acid acetyltransferase ArgJ [Actinomycetota bacterium]|nr:bifunctional glutamate N-acetyltransferase/amino-acid acetyltransferase ArgJ [Actinomycetota bacterium]